MTVTREKLLAANELSIFILNEYKFPKDYEQDILFSEEKINEILNIKHEEIFVCFNFPVEENYSTVDFSLDKYLSLSDEIRSIQIIEEGNIIKTNLTRYYIVHGNEHEENAISMFNLKTKYKNVCFDLDDNSFIVGLVNIKLGNYDEDYGLNPIGSFPAIKVVYLKEDEIRSEYDEILMVASYLFEIADSIGIALVLAREYHNSGKTIEELQEGMNSVRELEVYNEGMDLFVSATQTTDKELKFLNFYKILEYFAPIAINIEANEIMRKKLDAPRNKFEDGVFIQSIFDLARSTDNKRARDENLINAAFEYCFDFVGLFELLPNSLKTKSLKKLKKLDYSTDSTKLSSVRNTVSRVVYKTRNEVVHAKSNFKSTGEEVDFDELDELNEFMKAASSQAIRWYNRLPSHLKTIED